MTNDNYEKTEQLLIRLNSLIEAGHPSAGALKLARDHVQYACAYLAHGRNDEAGDHLTAARGYLKQIKAGVI